MIIIVGHTLVAEGDRDRVVAAHRDLVTRARRSDGCLDVSISADSVDPRRVDIVEVWRDSEALDGWRAAADAPETGVDILENNVKRYDAEDGGPLFQAPV
jgi:quinol monooxygenase YgiN